MQVVFETVCFFIYADPRASCPVFESENQKPKQEDKTVKYTPKKVFILEEGKYIEMSYEEFNRRKQEDEQWCTEKILCREQSSRHHRRGNICKGTGRACLWNAPRSNGLQ